LKVDAGKILPLPAHSSARLLTANPVLMMSNTSDSLPVFTGNSESGQYRKSGLWG
jgi:hypothetical protein